MIETGELLTLIAPCHRTDTTVLLKAPQDVHFELPNNLCDGCIARLQVKAEHNLHTSINIIEPEFKGRCIRSRGQDQVDFID